MYNKYFGLKTLHISGMLYKIMDDLIQL